MATLQCRPVVVTKLCFRCLPRLRRLQLRRQKQMVRSPLLIGETDLDGLALTNCAYSRVFMTSAADNGQTPSSSPLIRQWQVRLHMKHDTWQWKPSNKEKMHATFLKMTFDVRWYGLDGKLAPMSFRATNLLWLWGSPSYVSLAVKVLVRWVLPVSSLRVKEEVFLENAFN